MEEFICIKRTDQQENDSIFSLEEPLYSGDSQNHISEENRALSRKNLFGCISEAPIQIDHKSNKLQRSCVRRDERLRRSIENPISGSFRSSATTPRSPSPGNGLSPTRGSLVDGSILLNFDENTELLKNPISHLYSCAPEQVGLRSPAQLQGTGVGIMPTRRLAQGSLLTYLAENYDSFETSTNRFNVSIQQSRPGFFPRHERRRVKTENDADSAELDEDYLAELTRKMEEAREKLSKVGDLESDGKDTRRTRMERAQTFGPDCAVKVQKRDSNTDEILVCGMSSVLVLNDKMKKAKTFTARDFSTPIENSWALSEVSRAADSPCKSKTESKCCAGEPKVKLHMDEFMTKRILALKGMIPDKDKARQMLADIINQQLARNERLERQNMLAEDHDATHSVKLGVVPVSSAKAKLDSFDARKKTPGAFSRTSGAQYFLDKEYTLDEAQYTYSATSRNPEIVASIESTSSPESNNKQCVLVLTFPDNLLHVVNATGSHQHEAVYPFNELEARKSKSGTKIALYHHGNFVTLADCSVWNSLKEQYEREDNIGKPRSVTMWARERIHKANSIWKTGATGQAVHSPSANDKLNVVLVATPILGSPVASSAFPTPQSNLHAKKASSGQGKVAIAREDNPNPSATHIQAKWGLPLVKTSTPIAPVSSPDDIGPWNDESETLLPFRKQQLIPKHSQASEQLSPQANDATSFTDNTCTSIIQNTTRRSLNSPIPGKHMQHKHYVDSSSIKFNLCIDDSTPFNSCVPSPPTESSRKSAVFERKSIVSTKHSFSIANDSFPSPEKLQKDLLCGTGIPSYEAKPIATGLTKINSTRNAEILKNCRRTENNGLQFEEKKKLFK